MMKNKKVLLQKLINQNQALKTRLDAKDNDSCKNNHLQSAELALEAVRIEYETEYNRSNELTVRSGTFLSVMLVAFTFALNNINYEIVLNPKAPVQADWRFGLFFFTTCLCLICATASLILLSLSVVTKPFQRLGCDKLNDEKNLSLKTGIVARSVISVYTKSINAGEITNNKKARLYNWGVITGVISILLTVTIQITQSILKGVYYG
jgi:hypothetical protein